MKAALEQRLAALNQAIEQQVANLNVLIGRKSEIEHLLTELAREGATPPAAEIGGDNGDDGSESG